MSSANDWQLKNRPNLESLEKDAPSEKLKDDRKKKEKRGMLGGMFKRKDKKVKGQIQDGDDGEKTSSEMSRQSPQPKESMESLSQEAARDANRGTPSSHRQTSKLQKSPPVKLSPKPSYQSNAAPAQRPIIEEQSMGAPQIAPIQEVSPIIPEPVEQSYGSESQASESSLTDSSRMVSAASIPTEVGRVDPSDIQQQQRLDDMPQPLHFQPREPAQAEQAQSVSPLNHSRDMTGSAPSDIHYASSTKQVQPHPNYQRLQDDLDSSDDEDQNLEMTSEYPSRIPQTPSAEVDHHLAIAQAAQHDGFEPNSAELVAGRSRERLLDPPVQDLPQERQSSSTQDLGNLRSVPHRPPPLMTDTSSASDPSPASPVSQTSSGPRTAGNSSSFSTANTSPHQPAALGTNASPRNMTDSTAITSPSSTNRVEPRTAASSTSTTPTWSDASLRAYLDNDDTEIRDLFLIVHDKTGLLPPQRNHPIVKTLYQEENAKLDAISSNLDGLLGQYLARKGRNGVRS